MPQDPAPLSSSAKLTLLWESELSKKPNGRFELIAKKPVKDLSCKQAAKILGVSPWTVSDLFRLGLLKGSKPGARRVRSDGKASNAALRLDAESVATYKDQLQTQATREHEFGPQ